MQLSREFELSMTQEPVSYTTVYFVLRITVCTTKGF